MRNAAAFLTKLRRCSSPFCAMQMGDGQPITLAFALLQRNPDDQTKQRNRPERTWGRCLRGKEGFVPHVLARENRRSEVVSAGECHHPFRVRHSREKRYLNPHTQEVGCGDEGNQPSRGYFNDLDSPEVSLVEQTLKVVLSEDADSRDSSAPVAAFPYCWCASGACRLEHRATPQQATTKDLGQ